MYRHKSCIYPEMVEMLNAWILFFKTADAVKTPDLPYSILQFFNSYLSGQKMQVGIQPYPTPQHSNSSFCFVKNQSS